MNFNYPSYPPSYAALAPPVDQLSSLHNANECNNYVCQLSANNQSKPPGLVDHVTASFQPGNAAYQHHQQHQLVQWPVKLKHKTTAVPPGGSKPASLYRDNTIQTPRFTNGSTPNVGALYVNFNPATFEDGELASARPQAVGRTSSLKKKSRTIFTSQQIKELEKYFNNQQYITCQERDDLAAKTKLTPNQVKIWFQNRRYKLKTKGSNIQLSRQLRFE